MESLSGEQSIHSDDIAPFNSPGIISSIVLASLVTRYFIILLYEFYVFETFFIVLLAISSSTPVGGHWATAISQEASSGLSGTADKINCDLLYLLFELQFVRFVFMHSVLPK